MATLFFFLLLSAPASFAVVLDCHTADIVCKFAELSETIDRRRALPTSRGKFSFSHVALRCVFGYADTFAQMHDSHAADMTFLAGRMHELITATPPRLVQPIFNTLFSNADQVYEALMTTNVSVAPGLLALLRQTQMPDLLSFFCNGLPGTQRPDSKKLSAVYLHVLQHDEHQPFVYIGSATSGVQGYHFRLQDYERLRNLPRRVGKLVKLGYKISHSRLLAWAPMPSPQELPETRATFIVMEAFFTFAFGTCAFASEKYKLQDFFIWLVENRPYGPANLRTPLVEGRDEPFHLTYRQRTRLAAKMKRHKARRVARSDLHSRRRAMKERRFFCMVCWHRFSTKADLDRHYRTGKHRVRVQGKEKGPKVFLCDVCYDPAWYADVRYILKKYLETHSLSREHQGWLRCEAGEDIHPCTKCGTNHINDPARENHERICPLNWGLKKRVYGEPGYVPGPHHCHDCHIDLSSNNDLTQHFKCKAHKAAIARSGAALSAGALSAGALSTGALADAPNGSGEDGYPRNYCRLCQKQFASPYWIRIHVARRTHMVQQAKDEG